MALPDKFLREWIAIRKQWQEQSKTSETTKKIASKIGKGAKEFGKGVKSGVETAGKVAKVAKKAVTASESVQYSDWRDDFKAMEYEFIDLIKPEPLVSDNVSEGKVLIADVRSSRKN